MEKLRGELKQRRPFRNIREEAILNVWRTGDVLAERLQQLLKTSGLSQTQYNILRILRGAGDDGLPCGEIGERMLTRDPDVTRLLDRLARRGLARRARQRRDRRVVLARITPAGVTLLRELEEPVDKLVDSMMESSTDSELQMLIVILEKMRGAH